MVSIGVEEGHNGDFGEEDSLSPSFQRLCPLLVHEWHEADDCRNQNQRPVNCH